MNDRHYKEHKDIFYAIYLFHDLTAVVEYPSKGTIIKLWRKKAFIIRYIFSIFIYVATLRGGSRTAATPKMECFDIIANDFQPLTIITKCPTLDVAAVLDPSLMLVSAFNFAPAFLHIFPLWSSKLDLQSILIPNSFSHLQSFLRQCYVYLHRFYQTPFLWLSLL